MDNKFKDIDIKNCTHYFFDDMVNIKDLDPKSCKNILIYYIQYVIVKDLRFVIIKSVNPLYLIIGKINGYLEENNSFDLAS